MTPDPAYYLSLPKKRMGAGALFFNDHGELLIVKPSYKDVWEIPGGVVENDESPRAAVEREVKEEIGLSKHITTLLCVDYQDAVSPKTESIMFIFDGGIVSKEDVASLKIDNKEIVEFRFVSIKEACKLLSSVLARRVEQAFGARKRGVPVYLENREIPL